MVPNKVDLVVLECQIKGMVKCQAVLEVTVVVSHNLPAAGLVSQISNMATATVTKEVIKARGVVGDRIPARSLLR